MPAFRNEIIPKFKIILTERNETFYKVENLEGECAKEIMEHRFTVEEYLSTFSRRKKTNYAPKKPKVLLVIEEEQEREQEEKEKEKPLAKRAKKAKKATKLIIEEQEQERNQEQERTPLAQLATIANPEAFFIPSAINSEVNLIKDQINSLFVPAKKTKKNKTGLQNQTKKRKNVK